MGQALLQKMQFIIAEIAEDENLKHVLMSLENGQTRELLVDGRQGWWKRTGGWTPQHAAMAPTEKTAAALPPTFFERRGPVQVSVPNDAEDMDAFFQPLPRYAKASAAQRAEAGRRLLAISDMGWRSLGIYGPRDELYDR